MKNTPYRGAGWSKISLAVLERDNFTCQHCEFIGTRKSLDCHHVIPYRLFKNLRDANSKNNLTTLCKKCHAIADNKYWYEHPDLFSTNRVPYIKVPPRICIKCGKSIDDPSPAQRICKDCLTKRCDVCGKTFTIRYRNDREVRFCSRECNIIFRKKEAIWSHHCLDCGKEIESGRYYCWECWLKDPAGLVRPGRKPGRRPKDRSVIAIS